VERLHLFAIALANGADLGDLVVAEVEGFDQPLGAIAVGTIAPAGTAAALGL